MDTFATTVWRSFRSAALARDVLIPVEPRAANIADDSGDDASDWDDESNDDGDDESAGDEDDDSADD